MIEILPLSPSRFDDIPFSPSNKISCRFCIYWELPAKFEALLEGKISQDEAEKLKREWLIQASSIFEPLGCLAYENGEVVGYMQFSPPEMIPTIRYYEGRVSEDALFIACLIVSPNHRGKGIGSALLEFSIEVAKQRGFRALETFAYRRNDAPSSPVDFFLKRGFHIVRDGEFPLMRRDI